MENLGDKIHEKLLPIARAVHAPCIDPETNDLRPDSPCAKRIDMLNEGRYAEAFYDVFWPSKPEPKE